MTQKSGLVAFNHYITNERTTDYLKSVLGKKKASFVANVVSLVSNNVDLQACTPNTILYSSIKATSLGLPLDNNLGFAYVLPYKNKGVQEAQFQLGYKGFIQLAMRSGQFKTLNVSDVREGELVRNDRLTGELEFNWVDDRDGKPVIGYVAYFRLVNGFEKSLYMTVNQLEAHGKEYSKSYNSQFSNWKKRFDAMASKTVIKLLLSKYAPLSIEMQEAQKFDQAVIRSEDEFQYVDNDQTQDIDFKEVNDEEELRRAKEWLGKVNTPDELKDLLDSFGDEICEKLSDEIDAKGQEIYSADEPKKGNQKHPAFKDDGTFIGTD